MISIELNTKVTANKWFLPLVWASKIITEGLAEGKIRPQCVSTLMSELCKVIFFRWCIFNGLLVLQFAIRLGRG